jgi:hypothetical protein
VNVFTCCSIVLSIKIIFLIGGHPLHPITLDFSGDIFFPNYFSVFCKVQNSVCTSSSQSHKSTQSSAKNNALRTFENRVLRRIFVPKGEEVAGGWRRPHNETLRNMYASPDINEVFK